MNETNIYSWGGWNLLGAMAAISSLFITFLIAYLSYSYNSALDQLDDATDRARIKAELSSQKTAFQRYQSALSMFSTKAEVLFGSPWSFGALGRCYQIAFFYPITLLLLAWILGMPGVIGNIRILPETTLLPRLLISGSLIAIGVAGFLFFYKDVPDRVIQWTVKRLRPAEAEKYAHGHRRREFVQLLMYSLALSTTILISIAIFAHRVDNGVFTGTVIFAGVAAGVCAVGVSSAVASASASALAVGAASAVGIAGAFILADMERNNAVVGASAITLAIFLLLLPAANSLFDQLSWGLTRTLVYKIDHTLPEGRGVAQVAVALVVDAIAALICLIGLVILMSACLEITNKIYASNGIPEFDWKSQIELARDYPFSRGLLVTGMLATTLIPTVVHLTFGLGHAMTVWSPQAAKTASLISDEMPISDRQAVARAIVYRSFWMLPAFAAVCISGWALLEAFSLWVEPYGLLLEHVAIWSSNLISGA